MAVFLAPGPFGGGTLDVADASNRVTPMAIGVVQIGTGVSATGGPSPWPFEIVGALTRDLVAPTELLIESSVTRDADFNAEILLGTSGSSRNRPSVLILAG